MNKHTKKLTLTLLSALLLTIGCNHTTNTVTPIKNYNISPDSNKNKTSSPSTYNIDLSNTSKIDLYYSLRTFPNYWDETSWKSVYEYVEYFHSHNSIIEAYSQSKNNIPPSLSSHTHSLHTIPSISLKKLIQFTKPSDHQFLQDFVKIIHTSSVNRTSLIEQMQQCMPLLEKYNQNDQITDILHLSLACGFIQLGQHTHADAQYNKILTHLSGTFEESYAAYCLLEGDLANYYINYMKVVHGKVKTTNTKEKKLEALFSDLLHMIYKHSADNISSLADPKPLNMLYSLYKIEESIYNPKTFKGKEIHKLLYLPLEEIEKQIESINKFCKNNKYDIQFLTIQYNLAKLYQQTRRYDLEKQILERIISFPKEKYTPAFLLNNSNTIHDNIKLQGELLSTHEYQELQKNIVKEASLRKASINADYSQLYYEIGCLLATEENYQLIHHALEMINQASSIKKQLPSNLQKQVAFNDIDIYKITSVILYKKAYNMKYLSELNEIEQLSIFPSKEEIPTQEEANEAWKDAHKYYNNHQQYCKQIIHELENNYFNGYSSFAEYFSSNIE